MLREPSEVSGERLGLVLYAVGAVFAIYVHTTSLLIIAALNLVVLTMLLAKIKPELAQANLVVVGPWTEPMGLDYYGYNTDKVRFWTEHFPPNTESTVIAALTRAKDISRTALLDAIRSGQGVLLIQRDFERDWDGPLKTVQPPTKQVVENCSNGGACLEAYYWAPRGKN